MFCQLPSKLSLQNVWGYPSDSAEPRAPGGESSLWNLQCNKPQPCGMPASSGDPKFYTAHTEVTLEFAASFNAPQRRLCSCRDPLQVPVLCQLSVVSLGTRTALLTLGLSVICHFLFSIWIHGYQASWSLLRPLQGVLPIDPWHMAMHLLLIFLVQLGCQGLVDIQDGSSGLSFNILLPELATWFLWIAGTFLQVWFFHQKLGSRLRDFSKYHKDPVSNRENKEGVAANKKHW